MCVEGGGERVIMWLLIICPLIEIGFKGVLPGVPGVPWHPQILADQLTLSQPGGTDYAKLIITGTPGFSDLPTALGLTNQPKFGQAIPPLPREFCLFYAN